MISLKRTSQTFVLAICALFLLSACTQKNIILSIPKDLTVKVAEANQSICSYKGRVSVIYKQGNDDVRFKGYLNKDCEDNFQLKILGLFNTVAYDVKYDNGVVEAYKKDEDVSSQMAYFMRSKGLDSMVSLIRYPHVTVDESYKVKALVDEYIMTKGTVTVAAGQDYLIRRIDFGSEKFAYQYDNGKLSGLTFDGDGTMLEIKLR